MSKKPLYPHKPKGKTSNASGNPLNERISEKIQMMEGLLYLLAGLFNMTTTQVAKLLMSEGIRSWDDFAREVRLRRR